MDREIVVIAHDLRSCHNVGSLIRTAEGLGVREIIFTGYTPYPLQSNDTRLPHLSRKIHSQIAKTSLGAEEHLESQYNPSLEIVITNLRAEGFEIVALEQTLDSVMLQSYIPNDKVALLLGREVEGISAENLKLTDKAVVIPMLGQKESFNVVQAAAMALYHCRFK